MSTFDKEFHTMMNEEKEISTVVRQRLNQVYDDIRKEKNIVVYRTKNPWKKWLISAAAIVLCFFGFSNDKVQANLKELFGLNQAVQFAEEQNFFNNVDEKSSDQGITLQLTKVFADSGHIGFQINGKVADTKLLDNIESITFNYYIKDSEGNYVIDQLGDERFSLKSENPYKIGLETNTLVDCDKQKGTFTQQVIIESSQGLIPSLDHSTIEIVSVSFSTSENELAASVDGLWEMPLNPDSQNKAIQLVSYQVTEMNGSIEDLTAAADATGLRIAFKCSQNNEILEILNIKIIDPAGNEYTSTGFSVDDTAKMVNAILPYSAFQEETVLNLVISNQKTGETIAAAELTKQ